MGYRGRGANHYRVLAHLAAGDVKAAYQAVEEGRDVNPTCKNLITLEKQIEARLAEPPASSDGETANGP
jgi:hypothetical protein